MKYVVLFLMLFSQSVLACWKLEGKILFRNEKLVINQKVNHDQVYSFQIGNYITNVKVDNDLIVSAEILDRTNKLAKVAAPQIKLRPGLLGSIESSDYKMKFKLIEI
ncbi:MAG: hypothetical protein AB7I27_02725 [Bacteriovoracaceae bacterium]